MSEDEQSPLGSRSHRRRPPPSRRRRRRPPLRRRRISGTLLTALLALPVGLVLAAVLVFGSMRMPSSDPSSYAPGSLLPNDAAVPTPFFPSAEAEAAPPIPSPSPPPNVQAEQRRDGVKTQAEEQNSAEEEASSSSSTGSGGQSGSGGGGSGSSSAPSSRIGSTGSMNALSAQVFALVNEERAAAGCPPVRADDRLTAAAQAHSEDMDRNNYMSHTSLDGRTPDDRAREHGYHAWSGENIAKGQRTAAQVMRDWMNSPGHRRNILNCSNRALGVGESNGAWTQMFGRE